MIVVSDTTPLISLMKIGRLGLVEQLFGEVQIPEAVVGMLRVAYEEKPLSYEGIIECIEVLKVNGRHISDKLFSRLIEFIRLR